MCDLRIITLPHVRLNFRFNVFTPAGLGNEGYAGRRIGDSSVRYRITLRVCFVFVCTCRMKCQQNVINFVENFMFSQGHARMKAKDMREWRLRTRKGHPLFHLISVRQHSLLTHNCMKDHTSILLAYLENSKTWYSQNSKESNRQLDYASNNGVQDQIQIAVCL